MTPWKRTMLGVKVFLGANLGTRTRYLKGLDIPQPLRDEATGPAADSRAW